MNNFNSNIIMRLLFLLLVISGCSYSPHNEYEDELINKCLPQFQHAYDLYQQGNYREASQLFQTYFGPDTSLFFYESIPFIADCYRMLGKPDSGKNVYLSQIAFLQKRKALHEDPELKELIEWANRYPEFPKALRKEEGFSISFPIVETDKTPQPIYPDIAKRAEIEGVCYVQLLFDENGDVIRTIVKESTDELFIEPSLAAAQKWKFKPYKRFGRPLKSWALVPFRFKLHAAP